MRNFLNLERRMKGEERTRNQKGEVDLRDRGTGRWRRI